MLPSTNIQSIIGATLYGADKAKLGKISQVLVDAGDGHPTWAEVHVGTLGRHTTYVPLEEATWEDDDVYVPYDKDLVKDAPRIDGGDGLDPAQEQDLSRHYAGLTVTDHDSPSEPDRTADERRDAEPRDDRPRDGEARDDGRRDAPVQQLDEDGVLWEERVVVSKEKVPVAKVHLETTTVTENQEVTADVRKERVAVEETDTSEPPRI
jgi:hypothetical protein